MISKILAVGGIGLLAFGVYCLWSKNKKSAAGSSAAQKEVEKTKATTMQQSQAIAPPGTMAMQEPIDPMSGAVRQFDTNPAVLFSPPTTAIMMPSSDIGDVVMINSAHQLV